MRRKNKGMGETTLMAVGVLVLGLMLSTLGIDVGMYFNAQNQLQTVVNHSALAGASKLPLGETHAQTRARTIADNNQVLGQVLPITDLTINTTPLSVEVEGRAKYTPIIMQAFCNNTFFNPTEAPSNNTPQQGCGVMDVLASAKAVPAARDTMLVIDTSSSMLSLGNNRPLRDVQQAANLFIDMVASQATQASDRIGLVKFDQQGYEEIGLTSRQQSANYGSVKTKVNGLQTFRGSGWNTNYEAGIRVALDELESNGRPNAQKRIIFMTDGMPNLPAPANYYSYSRNEPYRKCVDPVNARASSSPYSACNYDNSRRRWVCPSLPSSRLPDSMILTADTACATTYANAMQDLTNAQTDRADQLKVTIDTIRISEDDPNDNATNVWRRLLKQPNWEPNQLAYMTSKTKGQSYFAANYDASQIAAIYQEAAKQIRVKLSAN
jgi:hypothetical protein